VSTHPESVNPWRTHLHPHELRALEETEQAILLPAPVKSGVGRWAEDKVHALTEKVPQSVRNQITGAVQSALDMMQQGSNWLVNKDSVHARLAQHVGPIAGSADLLNKPLHALDEAARQFISRATTGLTIEGAAAGAAGLVGLAADIPILYCTLFKTIQEVALCYGFPVKPPQERVHMLQTLDLGHNLNGRERGQIVTTIFKMQGMIRVGISAEALEAFSQAALSTGTGTQTQALVRNLRLARQLAFDLIERKLLQSLVIIGSAVGAAANYQLTRDVGLAALHLYRRRFLMELALRRAAAE
jgi:hypothetical protein